MQETVRSCYAPIEYNLERLSEAMHRIGAFSN